MYLKEIAEIGMGASTHGRSVVGQGDDRLPYINIKDIRDGYIANDDIADVPIQNRIQAKRYTVIPNDVVVTIRGSQFRSAIVTDQAPAIIAANLAYIRLPKETPITPAALCAWFQSEEGQHEAKLLQKGSGMLSISIRDLGNMKVKIPDTKTQSQLVELMNLKSQIQWLSQQITEKRELIMEASIKGLFSGKIKYTKEKRT